MKQEVTICDNCKTQKKQANRWWIGCVIIRDDAVQSLCLWPHGAPGSFGVENAIDLCGSRCVSEWISKSIL